MWKLWLPIFRRNSNIFTKKLDKEDFWIKPVRTFYPYGLNGRKKKNLVTLILLAVCIFQWKSMTEEIAGIAEFIEFFNDQLISYLRYSFLEIRKYLENCVKRLWKELLLCCDKPTQIKYNPNLEQWYS